MTYHQNDYCERLSPNEKLKIAKIVVETLLRSAHGDIRDPETWLATMDRRPIRIHRFCIPNGPMGEYVPIQEPEGGGVIQYNTAYPREIQARILVHELAHHELWPLIPNNIHGHQVPYSFGDNRGTLHEEIATAVEVAIMGPRTTDLY